MTKWSISFPGEHGQDVVETWTEDQIIASYYKYWCMRMIQAGQVDLSRDQCIEDWKVIHWAWEATET